MPKKVILELNETQARIVLECLEEWFRLRLAQGHDLANGLAFLGYDHKEAKPGEFDLRIERRDNLEAVVRAMLEIAFPWRKHGISRPVEPEVHVASDIWSTLRYELSPKDAAWDRTPFQMGPEPLPKITVEEMLD
jgi:hypothetical protein